MFLVGRLLSSRPWVRDCGVEFRFGDLKFQDYSDRHFCIRYGSFTVLVTMLFGSICVAMKVIASLRDFSSSLILILLVTQ